MSWASLLPLLGEMAGGAGLGEAAGAMGGEAGVGALFKKLVGGSSAAPAAQANPWASMSGDLGRSALGVAPNPFASASGTLGNQASATEDRQQSTALADAAESLKGASGDLARSTKSSGTPGAPGALSKLGSGLLSPGITGAASAAGAGMLLIDGFEKISKAMEDWTNNLVASQYDLQQFNGTIALANAQMTYQHNLQDIEKGQRTGGSYKFLTESKVANERNWLKVEAAFTNVSNYIAGAWNYLESGIGVIITNAPIIGKIWEWLAGKDKTDAVMPLNDFLHGVADKQHPWKKQPWRVKDK